LALADGSLTASLPDPDASRGAGRVARDLLTGAGAVLLAALAFVDHGVGARGTISAGFLVVLVVLSVIDIEQRILPNRIIFPATAVILAAQLVFFPDQALDWIIAPLGAAGFFLFARLFQREGLGLGDVKLMLLLGVGLGKAVAFAALAGTFAAGLVGLVLLIRHGRSARKMAIPFGPFLAFGAALTIFLADSSVL